MVSRSPPKIESLHRVRRLNSADDAPVWLMAAQDGTQVAVKHISTPLLALAARASFSQRLQILAHVRHPHVARILAGQVRRSIECVVVGDYFARGSLLDAVSPGERRIWPLPLPLPQAARLIGEIAGGISALHEREMLHGGVKLANIFLIADRDGQVRAQIGDVLLHRGFGGIPWLMPGGTPSPLADSLLYVAPEHYARRPTLASDQFALATIAFILLSGSPPYDSDPLAILRSSATPRIAAASSLNPTLPSAVDGVLRQGMMWTARARFDSTKAFAAALARALAVREPDRVLEMPPNSIPIATERREVSVGGATEPHEVIRAPEPLAVLRTGGADVIDPQGMPVLPSSYQWAPGASASAAAQPAPSAAGTPASTQAQRKIPRELVTAAVVLAMFLLSAVMTALGALVLLSIIGH